MAEIGFIVNEINEFPPTTNAGLDFSYAQWTPDTEIILVNVPWGNDYRDVVAYENKGKLLEFLNSRPHETIKWSSRARIDRPIRVATPYTTVMQYNYIAVHNGAYPTGGTDQYFFYFITAVEDKAPSTTEIIVQLDVWQTFRYDVEVRSAYVERGHIGIANANNYDHHGRTYLTAPEGLDIGSEYMIAGIRSDHLASLANVGEQPWIMAYSTTDLTADPMSNGKPNLVTASGSYSQNMPSGMSCYIWRTPAMFSSWLRSMRKYPHVTRGIIGAWTIPNLDKYGSGYDVIESGTNTIMRVAIHPIKSQTVTIATSWKDIVSPAIPEKYRGLNKFYTYPYCCIELTSHTGTPILLKPESFDKDDLVITRLMSLVPPNPRVGWIPYKYNCWDTSSNSVESAPNLGTIDDGGEWNDMTTGIMNFPTIGVVNDGYMDYMNSNSNSIAYQYSSADWSQQKALQGNQTAYNQAVSGQEAFNATTGNQIRFNNASTDLAHHTNNMNMIKGQFDNGANAMMNIAGGAGVGAVAGGVLGAVSNAMGWANTDNQITQSNINSNRLVTGNQAATNANMNYVRDTNKAYADFAANGDYANQIAGIQAKVQDAKLIQPSISGQVGGDAFQLVTQGWRVTAKFKTLNHGAIRMIGDFWLRYGYAINQWVNKIPANLLVNQKFTYWKMRETYLGTSRCPETYKQAIRGILEKGVTVWRNANDIGRTALEDNKPISGRYY